MRGKERTINNGLGDVPKGLRSVLVPVFPSPDLMFTLELGILEGICRYMVYFDIVFQTRGKCVLAILKLISC